MFAKESHPKKNMLLFNHCQPLFSGPPPLESVQAQTGEKKSYNSLNSRMTPMDLLDKWTKIKKKQIFPRNDFPHSPFVNMLLLCYFILD